MRFALADVYLQYPPGSNNRLDEGGGHRYNDNRLMDTQNNAKGGYGYGGDANNPAAPLKYMAGSACDVLDGAAFGAARRAPSVRS